MRYPGNSVKKRIPRAFLHNPIGRQVAILALVAGVSAWPAATAAGAAASTELLPHWSAGEKLHYDMTQTRRKTRAGQKLADESVHSDVHIEVIQAGPAGYRIAWTAGRPGAAKTTRVVLRVGPRGTLEGVENWKEIQAEAKRQLDRDAESWKKQGQDEATIQRSRELSAAMIATKEQIEDRYADEVRVFLMALGRSYPLGEPVPFRGTVPDPMGGTTPVPCKGQWLLQSIDKNGVALVDWSQSVSAEGIRRSIDEATKRLTGPLGKSAPGPRLKSLTIDEKAQIGVEVSSGWIRSLTHTRTVKTSTATRDEVRESILSFSRKSP